MQFSVNTSQFLSELALAQGAVERKTTIPVLGMIKLVARGETLGLAATNLEIGYLSGCHASVTEEGEILIASEDIYKWASTLPSDESLSVVVSTKGRARFKCGKKAASFPVLDVEAFPAIPLMGDPDATVPALELAKAFGRVAFAISSEDSKFTFTGAQLTLKADGFSVVATDGHRLSYSEHKADLSVSEPIKATISRKAINEVIKLSAKADEAATVDISIDENKIFFSFGSRRLYAVAVAGRFPDCARVFPTGDLVKAVTNSKKFSDAVNSIVCMADERSKAAKFTFSEGLISMVAKKDSGDGEDAVDCDYIGEPIEIGLNSSYINDFLKHAGGKNVEILLNDGRSAIEMRIEGDESWRGVIMPMSL